MTDMIRIDTSTGVFSRSAPKYKCSGFALLDLMKYMNNPVGIEIGSDVGETASFLLETRKDLFLYCVDPYEAYIDWNGNNLNDRDNVLSQFLSKMQPYEQRYKLFKMRSDDAIAQFMDQSVDFVFIDGLHEYEQTLRDCENYWPMVKKGGLLCGHDYKTIPGVNNAVNKFASDIGVNVMEADNDVWFWYKD